MTYSILTHNSSKQYFDALPEMPMHISKPIMQGNVTLHYLYAQLDCSHYIRLETMQASNANADLLLFILVICQLQALLQLCNDGLLL